MPEPIVIAAPLNGKIAAVTGYTGNVPTAVINVAAAADAAVRAQAVIALRDAGISPDALAGVLDGVRL